MALLDTTFLIDLLKEEKRSRPDQATAKLEELIQRGEPLRVPIFTLGELYVGVTKGTQPEKEASAIATCLEAFEIVPFRESTARIFGTVVGELERQGIAISDMDALIASIALEHDELLITRNVKHFRRISALRIEAH